MTFRPTHCVAPGVSRSSASSSSEKTIAARVSEMGREITAAYPAGDLLLLGLLKGSFIFMADLARAIERPLQVDFMVASSYGKGTTSSGNVRLLLRPGHRPGRKARPRGGGHHRHRAGRCSDCYPCWPRGSRPAWRSVHCSTRRSRRPFRRCASSGSTVRLPSSSGTDWITPRTTGTCHSSRSWGRRTEAADSRLRAASRLVAHQIGSVIISSGSGSLSWAIQAHGASRQFRHRSCIPEADRWLLPSIWQVFVPVPGGPERNRWLNACRVPPGRVGGTWARTWRCGSSWGCWRLRSSR